MPAIALIASLATHPVRAAEPAADAVEGAWIVSVGNGSRDRFLIVSGAKVSNGRIEIAKSAYGWIDAKGVPVREWRAEIFGDEIRLQFLTPADSAVAVRFGFDESTTSGTFLTKDGKKHEVRMTRIPTDELAELRKAARSAKAEASRSGATVIQARADSKIRLVYVGAPDCPSCHGYEAEYFGRKDLMAKNVPDFPKIEYIKSGLASYKVRDPVGRVPEDLGWLAGTGANGKSVLQRRGVPFFALVVDNRVWAQGHGVTALETLIAPEIRRAVAEKYGTR